MFDVESKISDDEIKGEPWRFRTCLKYLDD